MLTLQIPWDAVPLECSCSSFLAKFVPYNVPIKLVIVVEFHIVCYRECGLNSWVDWKEIFNPFLRDCVVMKWNEVFDITTREFHSGYWSVVFECLQQQFECSLAYVTFLKININNKSTITIIHFAKRNPRIVFLFVTEEIIFSTSSSEHP